MGKTILQTNTVVDTLVLSLGVGDGVVIGRSCATKAKQLLGLTRKKPASSKLQCATQSRSHFASSPLKTRFLWHATRPSILSWRGRRRSVRQRGTRSAHWDLSLQPGETRRIRLSYVVKYPAEKTCIWVEWEV
ncbi:MAG: hypothetical protein R3B47_01130 [Bacteroidia bacterium]